MAGRPTFAAGAAVGDAGFGLLVPVFAVLVVAAPSRHLISRFVVVVARALRRAGFGRAVVSEGGAGFEV